MAVHEPLASFTPVKAILFDVFGTVVDWEGGLTSQLQEIARKKGVGDPQVASRLDQVNWLAFAQEWRSGFWAVARAFPRNQDIDDFDIDDVHRDCLRPLIPKYGLEGVWTEAEINEITRFWHYLKGWPDSSSALHKLRRNYMIGTCANGTLRLLIDMSRHADLPWNTIFTSDVLHIFKPSPQFYLRAAGLLRLQPSEILMVAAHDYDLAAANEVGFRTCYVRRRTEDGGGRHVRVGAGGIEWLVDSFDEIVEGLDRIRKSSPHDLLTL
ncbi:haloacid dehalogenase [Gloeophyllum trabeum ATCC 11539]|uniref:Haloacid dehalogenase n=1 Tax=Gloeophyllum trabeum (strain ATCC 11539 / FP-39264 / Madison 617) TaxID=670483 RepID=S7QHG2_GLOTA|nr:haloacid dehalogenase [Gloeophyllum trabeum ATCC 11539]EPQ58688.1 haloacid dehalogenase [Gloeophyllum trabeum ATCC 11539]